MSVSVRGNESVFEVGDVRPLFEARLIRSGIFPYAVTRDGQRFLLNMPAKEAAPLPITMVVNWPASLAK